MRGHEHIRAALVGKFLTSSRERLIAMNSAFIELETSPGDEAVADELMRQVHTLKGESKLMQFADMNLVAHRTEELILVLRSRGFSSDAGAYALVLDGFDVLEAMVARAAGEVDEDVDFESLLARIGQALENSNGANQQTVPAWPLEGTDGAATRLMRLGHQDAVRVDTARLRDMTNLVGELMIGHRRMVDAIARRGALIGQWEEIADHLGFALAGLERPEQATREQLETAIGALLKRREAWKSLRSDAIGLREELRERSFESELRLEDLDGQVQDLRLQPLAMIFERYPRAMRDLAQEQGKLLRMQMKGGDIEVDRRIMEAVAEPLLHLLRNAVDHGLETPEEREGKGKARVGTITVSAEHAGSHVRLCVEDDGRGIDADAVREAAVRKQLLTQAEVDELSDAQAVELVFRPGFSSRDVVTDVSGRGVGLDVVKQSVEAIGGRVRVETGPAAGCSFVLELPISVSLRGTLIVRVGESMIGLPAEAVSSICDPIDVEVVHAGGRSAVRIEGAVVVAIELRELLGLKEQLPPTSDQPIVVLAHGGQQLVVRVDEVLGQRFVLHRPVDVFLEGCGLLCGCAVLEDGEIALQLSVQEMFQMVANGGFTGRQPTTGQAVSAQRVSILVADDSEVTRDLITTILRAEGFDVVEAVNGREALAKIAASIPDLVCTDLEMPVLDGFGLVRELRKMPQAEHLPIIVCSTRGSSSDKQTAAEVGANAYLVKSEFREDDLVRTVRRLLCLDGGS